MYIEEMIKKLEEIKKVYGNVRVTTFNEYLDNEGYNIKEEDLYETSIATIAIVPNTNEQVVLIAPQENDDDYAKDYTEYSEEEMDDLTLEEQCDIILYRTMDQLGIKKYQELVISEQFKQVEQAIAIRLKIPQEELYDNKAFALWTRRLLEGC